MRATARVANTRTSRDCRGNIRASEKGCLGQAVMLMRFGMRSQRNSYLICPNARIWNGLPAEEPGAAAPSVALLRRDGANEADSHSEAAILPPHDSLAILRGQVAIRRRIRSA